MRGYASHEIVQVLSMLRVRAGWGRLRSHIWWSRHSPGALYLCISLRHIASGKGKAATQRVNRVRDR
jgi:hypothetical protein